MKVQQKLKVEDHDLASIHKITKPLVQNNRFNGNDRAALEDAIKELMKIAFEFGLDNIES